MSTVMNEPTSNPGHPSHALLRAAGAVLAAVVCLAALLPLFEAAGALPQVTRLEISGELKYLQPEQIRAHVQPVLTGSLWELDLDTVRARAETLPWVAQARVERLWPDGVRVSVREHAPFARWGEQSLLAGGGVVFSPSAEIDIEGLPQLAGPRGQHTHVMQTWHELSNQIGAGDFAINALRLDERGEWTARTVSGIELRLGRGDALAKAALINGAVTQTLSARLAEISYVDLRYSNGFAVGWRDGANKGEKQ